MVTCGSPEPGPGPWLAHAESLVRLLQLFRSPAPAPVPAPVPRPVPADAPAPAPAMSGSSVSVVGSWPVRFELRSAFGSSSREAAAFRVEMGVCSYDRCRGAAPPPPPSLPLVRANGPPRTPYVPPTASSLRPKWRMAQRERGVRQQLERQPRRRRAGSSPTAWVVCVG